MTQQEQQMIGGLIQRVQNAPLSEKDPEAEQMIEQGLGRNPEALYVLAQTVLVQGYALEQAQKQLAEAKTQLQQQPPPTQKHTSFLGSIFGASDQDRPAPPPAGYTPVPTYPQQPQAYPPPASYASAYGQQGYPPAPPSGGGGFLRGAMQTAAGVAAGAMAFEGIESLMHGFGGHGGGSSFGNFGGSFGGNDTPREEVINNYYGDDANRGSLGSDVEDRRDDASSRSDFADTGNDNSDDSSSDDFSSQDDAGSDDTGGDDSSFS